MEAPLLQVRDLRVEIPTRRGVVRAVDGSSFEIFPGERLGIVGESGSGKSMTVMAIMRLLLPPARITSGTVRFEGRDVLAMSNRALQRWRGNEIAMIFQDPLTSLNPFLKIGVQIAESLEIHRGMSRREAVRRAEELLQSVHIADAGRRLHEYPHQLSGGMRQRVAIAIAMACRPRVILADEPSTALDVTAQARVLDVLRERTEADGAAVALITHDLSVVADFCDRVLVMYAGRIVETGTVDGIMYAPSHPYTRALLRSIPRLDQPPPDRLQAIPGAPPSLTHRFGGCPFAPRCELAMDICQIEQPPLIRVPSGNVAACHAVAMAEEARAREPAAPVAGRQNTAGEGEVAG
jgi:oligopeptide/dipeptide ABC transporter ATP-binding protein